MSIDALPSDILALVLQNLPPLSLISAKAVSKKWHHCALMALPISINNHPRISLITYGFKDMTSVLKFAKIKGAWLKCLNIFDLPLTNEQLEDLVQYCPNLIRLNPPSKNVNNETLELIKKFLHLESLNLLGAKNITTLAPLAQLTSLKSIELGFSGIESVDSLKKLPHLEYLGLIKSKVKKDELPLFDKKCTVKTECKPLQEVDLRFKKLTAQGKKLPPHLRGLHQDQIYQSHWG